MRLVSIWNTIVQLIKRRDILSFDVTVLNMETDYIMPSNTTADKTITGNTMVHNFLLIMIKNTMVHNIMVKIL
jgi:hypothetical protein